MHRYNKEVKQQDFQEIVWEQGQRLYREMPWRQDTQPYYVLVSELMLQQTQVERVMPKFEEFITHFPDVASLATASLSEVIGLWSGLGYNRRAKYLHEAAKRVVGAFEGDFPNSLPDLLSLPGVGPGTAGALMVYAYNQPCVFIETNVRTVYFYHFFASDVVISDTELRPLIENTLNREHPREFYWALMDYGSWLKRQGAGRLTQSRHYRKQTPLKGSVREVRGQILKALTSGELTLIDLRMRVTYDQRFNVAIEGLLADRLISQTGSVLYLTK